MKEIQGWRTHSYGGRAIDSCGTCDSPGAEKVPRRSGDPPPGQRRTGRTIPVSTSASPSGRSAYLLPRDPSVSARVHSTEQCLAVLHRAAEQASSSGVHVVEDVDIGNDAQQMLITSRDQLFEARRIKLGSRAKQFIMSTTSEELQDFLKSQRRM